MIYTWIGAPGWNPALGWVEPGLRIEIPVLVAGDLADLAQWLKPEARTDTLKPTSGVATPSTGEAKE